MAASFQLHVIGGYFGPVTVEMSSFNRECLILKA